ncbi:carbohydrate ABC transporter permease [Demetria terragena]|uniref:carbohydrate ABC transporter permease n=1 Tax=Demetria terragena TaxID=63959 RepID=UPI00037B45B6|nr:sugar ABC transporter permease [Demetria terragena]
MSVIPPAPAGTSQPADSASTEPAATSPSPRGRVDRTYALMLFPAVALFTLFITLPAIAGMFFSLTNYAGFGDWSFVGLANFSSMLDDPAILESYRFTIGFSLVTTILVNMLALALAIGLNAKIRLKKQLRTIFIIPMVLSAIIVAYVFKYFFATSLPQIAESLGWTGGESSLIASPNWAWLSVVIVTAWQAAPSAIIIYLAGLLSIPKELYEAASLDGASSWRVFRSITFPLVLGYVVINTILSFKNFLNAYDVIVGLTGGGPGTATTSVAMTIFTGFQTGDYAYQMANAVIFFVVTVAISLVQLRLIRGRGVSL